MHREEYHKFQAMNPYYRMLTHRICEYFGLGHNLDNSKQSVIVFKLAERPTLPTLPSLTFQAIINTSEQKQQVKQASMGSESGSDSSSSNSLTPNSSSNNLAALQETKIEKKQILKRDTNDQENLIRVCFFELFFYLPILWLSHRPLNLRPKKSKIFLLCFFKQDHYIKFWKKNTKISFLI